MKNRLLLIAGFAVLLFPSGCTENNLVSAEKPPSTSIDYLMFGHTESFCLSCDAIYKITNGTLLGANHQMTSDPDTVQLTQLPNSSYDLVSALTMEVPNRLVTGSISSINQIGTYFPDVGHYYVEVSQNKKIYRWYIEAGNIPADLASFVKDVGDAMNKLN